MATEPIVDLTGQGRSLDQLQQEFAARLKSGGGGGTFDGMERLIRLEEKAQYMGDELRRMDGRLDRMDGRLDGIDTRLRGVEGEVKTLIERVAHLPSKGFIVSTVIGGFALVAAVFGFHDQIVAFLTP